MIALVILGLGLLFIAAALPVGLEYTRQTVDLANAEAAGGYALDQLETQLRTSVHLYDWAIAASSSQIHRLDNVFRPRDMVLGTPPQPNRYVLCPAYEPVIKVRPLALGNIGLHQVLGSDPARGAELVDYGELAISTYLVNVWGVSLPANFARREFEFPYDASNSTNDLLSLVRNPVLPGIARVYPPVEPVTTFTVGGFFNTGDNTYPTYHMRGGFAGTNPALPEDAQFRERQKAVERRVAWTAFYRRVSYKADPGPDTAWFSNDDIANDPLRYELIVVVTQRPSVNHRFPQQDLTVGNAFQQPRAVLPGTTTRLIGTDRLAPTPWLVTFDPSQPLPASPTLVQGTDYRITPEGDRVILVAFDDPPTLTFRCTQEVGRLLSVGSVCIPAANDHSYLPVPPGRLQQVGFVPSAPESLPIYEVVERPDATTVVVKNNGFYPWLNGLDARYFPVWVIPPAFVERDSNGQPVYERTSPILKVVRRTVMLREINR
jgi:hypothetical protein